MDATALVLVAVVALGAWLWVRRRGSGGHRERRLRQICFGDAAQAERLIDAERSRTPNISRAEAVERAVARHERDNR